MITAAAALVTTRVTIASLKSTPAPLATTIAQQTLFVKKSGQETPTHAGPMRDTTAPDQIAQSLVH